MQEGKAPTNLRDSSNQQNDTNNAKKTMSEHKNHLSVVKIKENFQNFENFDLRKTSPKKNKIIESLNSKKGTCTNKIAPKLVKIPTNIIDSNRYNILNQSILPSISPFFT